MQLTVTCRECHEALEIRAWMEVGPGLKQLCWEHDEHECASRGGDEWFTQHDGLVEDAFRDAHERPDPADFN